MKPIIVIISGLSGSGKTVALRALEDSGFFCADNLPVTLIDSFVSIVSKNTDTKKIGIGVDIREKGFLSGINEVLKALRNNYRTDVLFLEAEKEVLVRRFKETRRPHPPPRTGPPASSRWPSADQPTVRFAGASTCA